MAQISRWRFFTVPAASLIALAIAVAASTSIFIDHLHTRSMDDLERGLIGLTNVMADQAERAFQAIELVQDAVLEELGKAEIADDAALAAFAGRHAMHQNLRARTAALPQVNAVTIVDRNGKLLNFSRYWPIPDIDLSDRDYFKVLSSEASRQRFIGQPVRNRGDGAWTIYIARKIAAPDGRFLGLVLGAVELGYFERLYAEIAPAEDAVVSIFRNDGTLLVRHPRREGAIGQVFPKAGAAVIAETSPAGGIARVVSPIDGRDRLVATRALARYPLIFSISRTTEAVLAAWRWQATVLVVAALLLEAALIVLLVIGVNQTRAQKRLALSEAARAAAEERERGERYLRAQSARYEIALDNMTQGLCLFDRENALIVMNSRFAQMHGVPDHLRQEGTPLGDVLDHLNGRGHSRDPGRASPLAEAWEDSAERGSPVARICDLADGTAIGIVHAPIPGGGWVCTHEDVTDRRRQEERIAHMARHDGLTGLPNRMLLNERMEEALGRRGDGVGTTVLCLDLDGFKIVNDTYGHPTGDELLCIVARRIQAVLEPGDHVSRLGGDEFAIVMAEGARRADAARLADRLVEALGTPIQVQGVALAIGTSIGIATGEGSRTTPSNLLRRADVALYQAKAAGRGTWRFFDPAMDADMQRRVQLGTDLRSALAAGQLELHYQPLVEAHTRAIGGFEALLRWRHPVHGFVSPAEFIPIAEEIGLIRPIGAWVLERACTDAVSWPEDVKVAVNLSPVQFVGGDLVEEVKRALSASGLGSGRLEVEITESVLLQDNEATVAVLHRIRELGVRISMDDFGTGYSSLSYLRRFPFDKIKIDQSFVRNLEHEPGSLEIVRAVVGLGNALGMSVLAEGVETPEQLAILTREGCEELQGYLFSRPRPVGEATALLAAPMPFPAPDPSRAAGIGRPAADLGKAA